MNTPISPNPTVFTQNILSTRIPTGIEPTPYPQAARLRMVGGSGFMSPDPPTPCLDLCRSSVSSKESKRMHAISMITIAVSPMTIPQYGHDISHPLAPYDASPL